MKSSSNTKSRSFHLTNTREVCQRLTHEAQGLTHTAVTPLDLVKTRRQIDSKLYTSNFQGWGKIYRGEGLRGIFTGYSPTFFGYSAQGALKYGWYEFFKKQYSDMAGPEAAYKYKTGLYLAASASAEFIADIALCPFEAVKVRMQGSIPSPYTGTLNGISTIVGKEGVGGLYKGLYPLWARQIPYTMMKFASFETIVEMIYARLPGQKSDYSKAAQTGVSFTGGYLAGILCAIVSHPADVMVSKLNSNRGKGEAVGSALGRIYKDIGFSGLWNGLPMRIVMIGTLTGLQWMIYVSFTYALYPTTYISWPNCTALTCFTGLLQDLYGIAHDRWWSASSRGEEVIAFGNYTSIGRLDGGEVLLRALYVRSEEQAISSSLMMILIYSKNEFASQLEGCALVAHVENTDSDVPEQVVDKSYMGFRYNVHDHSF